MINLADRNAERRPSAVRTLWLRLILVFTLLTSITAHAQWDGATYTKPDGGGTPNNPYQIKTPENLAWMLTDNTGFKDKYIILMDDIDLGGQEWKIYRPQIAASSVFTGFCGNFDGNGHTISNFKIYWDSVDRTVGFGFFSYIQGATVKKLTIKDATITRTTNGNLISSGSDDIKIGILAGAVGKNTVISDINLIGCRIDDGNGAVDDGKPLTIYAGGLIGDISPTFGGTEVMTEAGCPKITNIMAQVDIDLGNTTRGYNASKRVQFNVGGIIGRLRRTPAVGTNLTYTGKIKAPVASVGPIYGHARYNTNYDFKSFAKAYAGEKDADGTPLFDYTTPPQDMFYYNYQVWNPVAATPGYEEMSDTYPAGGSDRIYGARTFSPNNVTGTFDASNINNTQVWARFQGVNRGRSIDAPTPLGETYNIIDVLQQYNNLLTDPSLEWDYDTSSGTPVLRQSLYTINLLQNDVLTFRSYLQKLPSTINSADLRYKWSAVFRRHDMTWTDPVELVFDENSAGVLSSEYTLTDADIDRLKTLNDGQDVDIYGRFFMRVDLYLHDNSTGTDTQVVTDGLPVYAISNVDPVIASIKDPANYSGEIEVGGETVTLGSYLLEPKVMIGANDLTDIGNFRYEWRVKKSDGTWGEPDCPFHIHGEHRGRILPATYARDVKLMVYHADTDVLLAEAVRTLDPIQVRIVSASAGVADEQVYRLEALNPYDGRVIDYVSHVVWTSDLPGLTLTDDKCSTVVSNSALDPTLKGYTITATVTRADGTDPSGLFPLTTSLAVDRLELYFNEERDATGTSCLRSAVVLSYNTTPGSPNVYTGDIRGTWTWYVASLVDEDQSFHEVTAADGLTIVTDGLQTRLYGYDNEHIYRLVWTSDPSTYANADGTPVVYTYEKSLSRTIYVYDKAHTQANPQATAFDGLDPDGVPYPDGDDTNDGFTPWTALRTIEEAYRRLPPHNAMSESRIVLMGAVGNDLTYRYRDSSKDVAYANLQRYAKPATVCGSYYDVERNGAVKPTLDVVDYGGTLTLYSGTIDGVTYYEFGLGAPTTFVDLAIWNMLGRELYLYANRHDLTIDKGVVFKNFRDLDDVVGTGLREGDKLPFISVIAGRHNYNIATDDYVRPDNADPYLTTLVIRSGPIARLIGAARNNTTNAVTHNITGSPEEPFRTKVVIDIDPADGYQNENYKNKKYTHDIGLVTGGQTDGSVWGDVSIEMRSGKVARYISGNISFGRSVGVEHPDDSFFGRTEFSLYGGEVNELYGGSLGRYGSSGGSGASADLVSPYFYGTSVINIYGGEVHSNIYGAGAGGVMGVGRKTNTPGLIDYSPDAQIPYYNANGSLIYGSYDDATAPTSNVPHIHSRIRDFQGLENENDDVDNFVDIDLLNSSVEVNIFGGTIYGNVYGGGYGYSSAVAIDRAPYGLDIDGNKVCVSGNLYGSTRVRMSGGTVFGNVYGAGAGDNQYELLNATAKLPIDFSKLALVFGSSDVEISGGVIGKTTVDFDNPADITDLTKNPIDYYDRVGNAYGGGQGIEGSVDMATLYGNSQIVVSGGTVMGNIFGGADFSGIKRRPGEIDTNNSGNAFVTINGGVVGNSIFGGSRGSIGDNASMAYIEGETNVTVNGGAFYDNPYINEIDQTHGLRSFNIYGGGFLNCIVDGDAHVQVNTSLLTSMQSFLPEGANPNEWPDAVSDFQRAYMDITYRRFCIYGGGYGEKTRVLNTDVSVYISTLLKEPHGHTLTEPYYTQSFFDIAGGGYSGDVGYWAPNDVAPGQPGYDRYDHYVGGNCHVTIDGYTYARKVIGGGFYGSCYNTDLQVKCGSLRQVYGGSLLGYVHGRALLRFGNRTQDFLKNFDGSMAEYSEAQIADAARRAAAVNKYLFITENIYGGNDVKGIVGTTRWIDPLGQPGYEGVDGAPLFAADVDPSEKNGIVFEIYGGTFMGDVYCAGNGHYRGYYVPEWVRYDDGPDRMYSPAISSLDPTKTGKIYRARPMVGSVNVNIQGNSDKDAVAIWGDFYGGGRSCTIGQWNTLLPFDDPRRLVKGGHLHINFGGNVSISGGVYLGSDGRGFSDQTVIPAGIDLDTFDGSTTKELNRLGESAYGHWYYNTHTQRYEPGYPVPGDVDGNYGLTGEHMLRGYLKNIEMPGDVELTFYSEVYKTDNTGRYLRDASGNLIRRQWVPAELAVTQYDAQNINFYDFYLGGRCGSMTNNEVMYYNYTTGTGITDKDRPSDQIERYGAIYRVSISRGVSITNAAVMGSRDAEARIYPHKGPNDFTAYVTTDASGNPIEPYYYFDGGIVTQSPLTYDIIAYNDMMSAADPDFVRAIALPDDFYTSGTYSSIRNADTYTMADGTVIKRKKYVKEGHHFPNFTTSSGLSLSDNRYDLAVTVVDGKELAYAGERETRAATTAVKAGVQCTFTLHEVPNPDPTLVPEATADPNVDASSQINPYLLEGGLIYGGCYQSGVTMGDVIMLVASDMMNSNIKPTNADAFKSLSSLRYNIGRVFGGGFGVNTEIQGSTYVNLLLDFVGMNVFGGGFGGKVTGSTTVNYIGSEDSYVFGSIYGGGLSGEVGTSYRRFDSGGNLVDCLDTDPDTGKPVPAKATNLTLISGNVSRVFGGSCLADVYGSTNIVMQDQVRQQLSHLDLEHLVTAPGALDDMLQARLIVGSAYGGNDIAGTIYTFGEGVSDTNVTLQEYRKSDTDTRCLSPGSADNYNGFPLVGSLYGGSNGNYGTAVDGVYDSGEIDIYGLEDPDVTLDANGWGSLSIMGKSIPNVRNTRIDITGGTVIDAYCGGNKATVTENAVAKVHYSTLDARAGFDNTNGVDDPQRIWNVMGLSSQEQFKEVLDQQDEAKFIYKYQIYHFFSGNDNADMAIQPDVRLEKGHIGSAYGGGNAGRMTYCTKDALNKNVGITLTVQSDSIHIESLYGGGRVGDIQALDTDGNPVAFAADEYGATLNVHAGLIEAVYGGNDVCGTVYNGTNVNITGAISGDVYGAGNGNYLYQLDTELPVDSRTIYESYDDVNYGGRYFRVPPKSGYGATSPTDAQKILAINSYRPNVDKSFLNIEGSAEMVDDGNGGQTEKVSRVWVKGSVYCGGNSSTIRTNTPGTTNTIRFSIGDYVTLNGVFLGSNGAELADTRDGGMMLRFEKLNALQLNDENDVTEAQLPEADKTAASHDHYPFLLSLYMRAVEVDGVPDDFNFNITKGESYIGDFCLGGNHGSMMTDKTIKVTIPESVTIFGNIVGGCYDTAFQFRNRLHSGGMTRFLKAKTPSDVGLVDPTLDENNKVWLIVKSHFAPLRIHYPLDGDIFKIRLEEDIVETDGVQHYGPNRCNIYGGCYKSGLTVGDIRIDLYSNMGENADPRLVLNGIDHQVRSLDVVGAGYGKMSMLIGDTKVRMLPSHTIENGVRVAQHPTCAAIFGGSQQGQMVGNTFVSIRDGRVFTNVYGASESAVLRGSTNIVVGYPESYRCKMTGIYNIERADRYTEVAVNDLHNHNGSDVVKDQIWLHKGDLVAPNVHTMISSRVGADASETKVDWFGEQTAPTPATFDAIWDDIDIHIGNNNLYDLDAPYYGHGNIYGGGFVSNNSDVSLAGQPTVLKFDDYADRVSHPDVPRKGYGGNAMIIIGDNPRNSDLTFSGTADMALRDHISIGTARLRPVSLQPGENKIGKYYVDETKTGFNRFVHQEAGIITEADVAAGRNKFYEVEGDGGIYGGGRKVFVEGFRACDLYGYGYAEHTPQHPKHLNTIQRIDLFTMRDCCFQLVGAPDYASSQIDATPYSMTRVGEFRMISSLDKDATLDTGTDPTAGRDPATLDSRVDKPGYMIHNTPRSRNYMGFFRDVHYVGAVYSSTSFDDNYHGADGAVVTGDAYRTYKERMVTDRREDNVLNYPKRNVATAHNMIGINNGFTLKVQGTYTEMTAGGKMVDRLYYGPIVGVVEVKLLTLISDEGGGYIYALNRHLHPDPQGAPQRRASGVGADDKFTESTGNFVFPGRMFSSSALEAHYMYDDCYPLGYDVMTTDGTRPLGWQDEEIHYWYVSGNSYYFNSTLTAYTYNNPKDFFLNNYDNLIVLSGVEAGKSDIKVKSIVWGSHADDLSGYECDLTDYTRCPDDKYKLWVSVDKYTNINHKTATDPNVTKGAYVAAVSRANYDDSMTAAPDGINPNGPSNGKFDDKETARDNSPLLGITLSDNIDNSAPEYYKKHLSQPDNVTIVLQASRPDENGVPIVTNYTLNLTIIYLQGPHITGHINIENCALPGEVIMANTGDLKASVSEELIIEDRQWVAMSPDKTTTINVNDYRDPTDYNKLELPVWFYNDGWDLYYRLIINGESFDVGADPESEHPNIIVHNYHRMKALYGHTEIYQVLTPGSRIYIEDDADLDRFMALADTLSMPGHEPREIAGSHLIDRPKDCKGLIFFLTDNLTMPEGYKVPARFAGELYGDGHLIYQSDPQHLFSELSEDGKICDIGFVASSTDPARSYVLGANKGLLQNCFYYNPRGGGNFCGPKTAAGYDASGLLRNCFQNGDPTDASTYASDEDFRYGRVAYNINGYYLKGRYDRLNGNEPQVQLLDDFYYDGDYRYAFWDQEWGVGQPAALRTAPRPNYMNYERTGRSNHNMDHPEDLLRYVPATVDAAGNVTEPAHYKPHWTTDYLRFSQNLSANSTHMYPRRFTEDTRVYRASGFYGSKVDRGLHFNVDAAAVEPTLTAVDFTGFRDRGAAPDLVRTVDALNDVFCRPMIDLPAAEADDYGISPLNVVSNATAEDYGAITRNLLVYTKPEAADKCFPTMLYEEADDVADISAHVLKLEADGSYSANEGLLHLVDKQDFNAPIEFCVGHRAWYERSPQAYSSGNEAWDGICLPFSVNRVSTYAPTGAEAHSHGEITHFYGEEKPYDTPNLFNRMHEYWLRSLTGVDTDALVFSRPGVTPLLDEAGAARTELTDSYHYSNTWFTSTYGDYDYIPEHNQYKPEGVDFVGYRFITASTPYIISFPSERYYEFDLSGEFYKRIMGESEAYPMSIRYEYLTRAHRTINSALDSTGVGDAAALDKLAVGVTDDLSRCVSASKGSDKWYFTGTFARRTFDSASIGVLDDDGATFRRANSGESVLPFRAFLSSTGYIKAPQRILGPQPDEIVVPGSEQSADELSDIVFSVEDNVLVAMSPRYARVPLCDTAGRVVRVLEIFEGRNEYTDLNSGIYIAGRFKFYINW